MGVAMIQIALPWPDKALSPNGRSHPMAKARAVKAARHYAWAAVLEALAGTKPSWEKADLHWEFRPKTANVPDDDNALSSVKSYRDGIADALGMNDRNFQTTHRMAAPTKGGSVLVTISEAI